MRSLFCQSWACCFSPRRVLGSRALFLIPRLALGTLPFPRIHSSVLRAVVTFRASPVRSDQIRDNTLSPCIRSIARPHFEPFPSLAHSKPGGAIHARRRCRVVER